MNSTSVGNVSLSRVPSPLSASGSSTGSAGSTALACNKGTVPFAPPRNRAERRALERQLRKDPGYRRKKSEMAIVASLPSTQERAAVPTPPQAGSGWLESLQQQGSRLYGWLTGTTNVADASADEIVEVCDVNGECRAEPLAQAKIRSVNHLVNEAKERGYTVEMSPSMRKAWMADGNLSIQGAVVVFADHAHAQAHVREGHLDMIHARFEFPPVKASGAAWLDPDLQLTLDAAKDLVLVEGDGSGYCVTKDWSSPGMPSLCVPVDDQAVFRAAFEVHMETVKLAESVLTAAGLPLKTQWENIDAAYQHAVSRLKAIQDAGGDPRQDKLHHAYYLQDQKNIENLKVTSPARDKAMLDGILRLAKPDRTIFFLAGAFHTENLREPLFKQFPVIYIHKLDGIFSSNKKMKRDVDPV